ncbi:MAG TPA: divalent-cation tolerance protein CutA, partial [bacterium]|nr:divalent-cation tolerance protein CutA [bacterium]
MKHYLVYITAPHKEVAKTIGRTLVEDRLAACVNIIENMTSLYWWEGKINEDSEVVLLAKTRESLVESLIAKTKILHPYECPCVVALPIEGGNQDFFAWMNKCLS